MKGDSMGALSWIPPKVIMIHNMRSDYMYKICDYDICVVYDKLSDEGILKDEFNFFERKWLTHALYFLRNFKI